MREIDRYVALVRPHGCRRRVHLETDATGLPLVANFVSLDLTDDEDPEIGEKIAKVHSTRFTNRPEILRLVEGLDSYTGAGVPDDSPTPE